MENIEEGGAWAALEFGQAELGDKRRTARVVSMAACVAARPGGRVSEVFEQPAEREGAYRLLENQQIPYECLVNAAAWGCAQRCAAYDFVFAPTDGTSMAITDRLGTKGLGSVGTYEAGARGIKSISVIAVSPKGEPLGLCAQRQWLRPPQPKKRSTRQGRSKGPKAREKQREQAKRRDRAKARRRMGRRVEQKETRHWIEVSQASKRRFEEHAPQTRLWFQMDREADAWPILQSLLSERPNDWFTVRAAWNRCVVQPDGQVSHLHDELQAREALGGYELDVVEARHRSARRARMVLRVATVVVLATDQRTGQQHRLPMNVVWAHESGTTPTGEKPLDWMLLTNHPIATFEQAQLVVYGYSQRWKIEEVHKTWKSGRCNVEQSQLRSADAAMKWATLLFTVAIRTERLKLRARSSPDLPASVELSHYEIQALLLLKRRQKKRTETVPDTMPTLAQAARWTADLGGYTGKSSGGPFGSITLGRGLERVILVAEALEALDLEQKAKK